jgi:hypothetical protein
MVRQPYYLIIVLLAGGMLLAVYLLLGQRDLPGVVSAPPAAVAPGDQEVAWFNPATNVYAWTRLLAGLQHLLHVHPELGLEWEDRGSVDGAAAHQPAVGLKRRGYRGRLWVRWYKLTGQQGTREWLDLLLNRTPPPLAIIGGGSSDRARDLALALANASWAADRAPLLLLTQATADHVQVGGQTAEVMALFPRRTFRFCFSNSQMADMILDFIWNTPNLRPSEGSAYLLAWRDDPYSVDLVNEFRRRLRRHLDLVEALPGTPPQLVEVQQTWDRLIPYSIGRMHEPNEREAAAIQELAQDLAESTEQARALLVMPGEAKQTRRVLRGTFRSAPTAARRFVLTVGDSVGFNSVYRDRRAQWSIQDTPCPLVLFCHRNPVDAQAGFAEEGPETTGPQAAATATDDLLLYSDVVGALAVAAFAEGRVVTSPGMLNDRLRVGGAWRAAFDARGNRLRNTGEHLVVLEPKWAGERVQPQAYLSVFGRDEGQGGWSLERRLVVDYAPPPAAPSD